MKFDTRKETYDEIKKQAKNGYVSIGVKRVGDKFEVEFIKFDINQTSSFKKYSRKKELQQKCADRTMTIQEIQEYLELK